jgi:hypothetical protein
MVVVVVDLRAFCCCVSFRSLTGASDRHGDRRRAVVELGVRKHITWTHRSSTVANTKQTNNQPTNNQIQKKTESQIGGRVPDTLRVVDVDQVRLLLLLLLLFILS